MPRAEPRPARRPGAFYGALAAILALAAALRAIHLVALRGTPWFAHLVVDPAYYDAWAQRIAGGDWLGDRAFYMDPLYPYWLATVYRVSGRDLLVVRVLQIAMSVAACGLVARLGWIVGGRWIAVGAALWMALYKPEIMFTGEIEKTTLSVLLTAGALVLFFTRSPPAQLAGGLVLGLASLTRGNLLLFAPLGALLLWRDAGWRAAGLFLAGVALALAPVTWRNHHVSGDWVLTTTQGGQNFYMGNNPGNLSGSYGTLPFLRMNPTFEETDFHAEAEKRTCRVLDARATSRFWYGEALRFFRDQPATALRLAGRKLALVWNDYEISDNQDQYVLARDSPVMAFPLPGFGLTAVLAAVGVVATARRRRTVRRLVAFALLYTVSVALFFVFGRYRIQLVPALAPLVALGVRELVRAARAADVRRLARDGAVAAVAGVFAFHTIEPFRLDHPQIAAMQLHKLADVHLLAGDRDGSIAFLGEAVSFCPELCPGELDALVEQLVASGRSAEAIDFLRRVVEARPAAERAAMHLRRLAGDSR